MKKYLKRLVLLLAVTLAGAMASAWDWTSYCENLDGNHWLVKAGVGYGYSLGKFKYSYDLPYVGKQEISYKGAVTGFAIPIQGEFLLSKIPLGITLDFRPLFGKTGGWKSSSIALMAGANYHVAPGPEWLDLYAGLEMGFYYTSTKWEVAGYDGKAGGAGFAFGAHLGSTFMFSKHIGLNVEVGYPTYGSASVAFAF
ncbi:MAG: outer membrane beta-barrel protein [Treponema sp.]|nr:outer membrane beta-barrel protein [Treponema sp.]